MEPLEARDPRQVGGYRLRARLGAGGMGRVFLGYSPAGRAVAVKVVHPELAAEPAFLTRFRREVAAARAVSGAYTAPVVAAGPEDDPPWMATAFVAGPSLAEAVAKAGPLPEPWVWRLMAGLTEALQEVHACGLVHRDLTPRNVLLAADGPRVIDFGISRAIEGTALTATGLAVGTPSYMSPEQANGARVGPASDVFSLGCVIVFAATGTPPFGDGQPAPVLYRVVHADAALSAVPAGLGELVAGCLAKQPDARPSVPALVQAILAGTPAHIGTPPPQSFWPEAVARLIPAQEERAGSVAAGAWVTADSDATASAARSVAPAPAPGSAVALAEDGTPVSLPAGGTGHSGGSLGPDGAGHDGGGAGRGQPAVATAPGAGALAGSGQGREADGLPTTAAAAPSAVAATQLDKGPRPAAPALPGDAAGLAPEPVQPERSASGRPAVLRVTRRRVLAGLAGASAAALAAAGWELSQPGTPRRRPSEVRSHPATGKRTSRPGPSHTPSTQPGATVWSSSIGGGGSWAALEAGAAYVVGSDSRLYALSADSGKLRWSNNIANTDDGVETFAVAGGVLYLAPNGTTLVALRAADGATLWTVGVNDASGILYTPLVVGDVIYLASGGYTMWALRAADGKTIWGTDTGGGTSAGLAAAGGKLFVATLDGMLYALSAADGSTLWQVGANGQAATAPVTANGTVYVVGGDGTLLALSAADGSVLSSVKIPGAANSNNLNVPFPSTPVVAGGVVYLVNDTGVLYAVSASAGKTLWTARTGGGFDPGAGPRVTGDAVYAVSNNGELIAIATASGTTLWRTTVGGSSTDDLVVADGIALVFGQNTLCAVRT